MSALVSLSPEMDELMREVAKEQNERLRYGTPRLDASRTAVSQVYIPAA